MGYYDNKVRIINQVTWQELFCLDHNMEELTEFNTPDVLNIYLETENADGIYFEAVSKPFAITSLPFQQQKP